MIRKNWKKEYDNDPKVKAQRKWRYQVKDKETLLKEATQGPKEGTYEMGVAMKRTNDEGPRGDSNAKKRKKREWCHIPHKDKSSKHYIAPKNDRNDAGPPTDTST